MPKLGSDSVLPKNQTNQMQVHQHRDITLVDITQTLLWSQLLHGA